MKLHEINDAIVLVCPIYGINSDGGIQFKPEATEVQKAQALAIIKTELPKLIL